MKSTRHASVARFSALLACAAAFSAEALPTNSVAAEVEQTSEVFRTDVFSYRYGCYRPQISLDGRWEFQRDKLNRGTELGFHEGRGSFAQTIGIPGVPQAQGLGEPNRSQKWYLNEPFRVRRLFKLPTVPPEKRVWLRIGGTKRPKPCLGI